MVFQQSGFGTAHGRTDIVGKLPRGWHLIGDGGDLPQGHHCLGEQGWLQATASDRKSCRQWRVRVHYGANIRSTTIQRQMHRGLTRRLSVAEQDTSLEVDQEQVRRL